MSRPLLYSGSVKDIYRAGDAELIFDFTDAYSVFDWGRMPDLIPGKGRALASIFESTYLGLERAGVRTHFVKRESETRVRVREAGVHRPEHLGGQWVYPKLKASSEKPALLPLECVFRFGRGEGSSLSRALAKSDQPTRTHLVNALEVVSGPGAYALRDRIRTTAGEPRVDWSELGCTIEFFTKLEPEDRKLTRAQAGEMLVGVSDPDRVLDAVVRETTRVAEWLRARLITRGISLIDGKLEWGWDGEALILVDAIGPDELRLEKNDEKLSKEFLREFYRGTNWFEELTRVKREAQGAPDWKARVKVSPPPLSPAVLSQATSLYSDLARTFAARPPLRVLVFGSGAREHAIVDRVVKSERCLELVGLDLGPWAFAFASARAALGAERVQSWERRGESWDQIAARARDAKVDLAIFGPDQALSEGAVDAFMRAGVSVFGPTKAAAKLEWSKAFCKEVLTEAGVPTPRAWKLESPTSAQKCIAEEGTFDRGGVAKLDGLALGKGVIVAQTREELRLAVDTFHATRPVSAEFPLLIEERVQGEEISWLAFCDGQRASLFAPARDYKRARDGDLGPNTGGMGAYAPVTEALPLEARVRDQVFLPTLRAMRARGTPFRGILYAGLMWDERRAEFTVLEFNARFGDPEAQVLLPLMSGDFLDWAEACASGGAGLREFPERVPRSSLAPAGVYVVAASPGYPESVERGGPTGISIERLRAKPGSWFAGGLALDGTISGGRVFGVLGEGNTVERARAAAYRELGALGVQGRLHFRRDIAERNRILVLASGRGSNFMAIAEAQREIGAQVCGLLSDQPAAPVLARARELGIPAHVVSPADLAATLRAFAPTIVFLAGYTRIIPSSLIEEWRDADGLSRILNIHPSLLPKYPGLDAYGQARRAGERVTGCTVHRVERAVDGGPILGQDQFPIDDCTTVEEVEARGLSHEHRLVVKVLAEEMKRCGFVLKSQ